MSNNEKTWYYKMSFDTVYSKSQNDIDILEFFKKYFKCKTRIFKLDYDLSFLIITTKKLNKKICDELNLTVCIEMGEVFNQPCWNELTHVYINK